MKTLTEEELHENIARTVKEVRVGNRYWIMDALTDGTLAVTNDGQIYVFNNIIEADEFFESCVHGFRKTYRELMGYNPTERVLTY